MFASIAEFLNTNASAIQTIAVVIALGYVAAQTRQLGRQLKLSNITSASQNFRDQNLLLLENAEARELRHETVQGCLADLYFGLFKARWRLHRARLLDRDTWESDLTTMRDIFRQSEFMPQEWENRKRQYAADFRTFIDKHILPKTLSASAPGVTKNQT